MQTVYRSLDFVFKSHKFICIVYPLLRQLLSSVYVLNMNYNETSFVSCIIQTTKSKQSQSCRFRCKKLCCVVVSSLHFAKSVRFRGCKISRRKIQPFWKWAKQNFKYNVCTGFRCRANSMKLCVPEMCIK